MKLSGRVALLTAAAGAGIGHATARMMAKEGARIVVTDIHPERPRAVAQAIQNEFGVEAIGLRCDVTKREEIERVMDATMESFGRLDILFNNAGTNRPSQIRDMTDEDWETVISTCLTGTFYACRAALLLATGG